MRALARSKGGAAYRYDENSHASFAHDVRIFHATQAFIYFFLFYVLIILKSLFEKDLGRNISGDFKNLDFLRNF